MGRIFKRVLEGPPGQLFVCKECSTHLTTADQIISKSFNGRGGRAYLMDTVVNVSTGPGEERRLMTGMHTVADIYCIGCDALLGWTYEDAREPKEKYKEGKFLLERTQIVKERTED